jgi:hypothetical protein
MFALFKNNVFVKVISYDQLFHFLDKKEYFAYIIQNVASNYNDYSYNLQNGTLIITKMSYIQKIKFKFLQKLKWLH